MRRNPWTSAVVVFAVCCTIFSCTEQPKSTAFLITSIPNVQPIKKPNKKSELAVLMRTLYNDVKAERKLLLVNQYSEKEWSKLYGDILNAEPTDAKNTGATFKAFETHFLDKLKEYQLAQSQKERVTTFNTMVSSCKTCHQEYCPGPLIVIKKLPIPQNN
mgnify:CR=1 FL=1